MDNEITSELLEAKEAVPQTVNNFHIEVPKQPEDQKKPTNRKMLYTFVIALVPMFVDWVAKMTGYDVAPILKSIGQVFGIGG